MLAVTVLIMDQKAHKFRLESTGLLDKNPEDRESMSNSKLHIGGNDTRWTWFMAFPTSVLTLRQLTAHRAF